MHNTPHSKETKEKMRQSHLGEKKSPELIEKIRERVKKEWETGKRKGGWKLSEENRKNISNGHKGKKSHLWKGGISFEEYSLDWTQTLKRSIRERDHYVCQICSDLQVDETFSVHHIDYNKKNCNPENLITLCHNCHMKTNHHREKWIEYFENKKLSDFTKSV